MSRWPPRTHVCKDCRTRLRKGESCDWITHQSVDLTTADGREAFMESLWGPVVEVESTLTPYEMRPDGSVVPRMIRRRQRETPRKASPAIRERDNATFVGLVAEAATAPAPIRPVSCVAYGVVATGDGGLHDITLRDGATLGFTLRGQSGATLVVPEGRVDIVNTGQSLARWWNLRRIRRYLELVDPLRRQYPGQPPALPVTAIYQAVIRVRDRVAVHNRFHRAPAPGHSGAAYRNLPGYILRPQGTPCLEILMDAE